MRINDFELKALAQKYGIKEGLRLIGKNYDNGDIFYNLSIGYKDVQIKHTTNLCSKNPQIEEKDLIEEIMYVRDSYISIEQNPQPFRQKRYLKSNYKEIFVKEFDIYGYYTHRIALKRLNNIVKNLINKNKKDFNKTYMQLVNEISAKDILGVAYL